MTAMCCAAAAATFTATASASRPSVKSNNAAAAAAVVVAAPSTAARVAVAPTRGTIRTSAVAEAAADTETSLVDSLRPSSADCARTLVNIANTGTISTTCDDGMDGWSSGAKSERPIARTRTQPRPHAFRFPFSPHILFYTHLHPDTCQSPC